MIAVDLRRAYYDADGEPVGPCCRCGEPRSRYYADCSGYYCAECAEEPQGCGACSQTGEGRHGGSCVHCGGSGELPGPAQRERDENAEPDGDEQHDREIEDEILNRH